MAHRASCRRLNLLQADLCEKNKNRIVVFRTRQQILNEVDCRVSCNITAHQVSHGDSYNDTIPRPVMVEPLAGRGALVDDSPPAGCRQAVPDPWPPTMIKRAAFQHGVYSKPERKTSEFLSGSRPGLEADHGSVSLELCLIVAGRKELPSRKLSKMWENSQNPG